MTTLIQKLKEIMTMSIGSENFYRYQITGLIYTQGVKHVADTAGAYWLVDLILSRQTSKFRANNEFQVWYLEEVKEGQGINVVCEDGNNNVILKDNILVTDFPIEVDLRLYFESGTLLLPMER